MVHYVWIKILFIIEPREHTCRSEILYWLSVFFYGFWTPKLAVLTWLSVCMLILFINGGLPAIIVQLHLSWRYRARVFVYPCQNARAAEKRNCNYFFGLINFHRSRVFVGDLKLEQTINQMARCLQKVTVGEDGGVGRKVQCERRWWRDCVVGRCENVKRVS